jgi:hypothetical protein
VHRPSRILAAIVLLTAFLMVALGATAVSIAGVRWTDASTAGDETPSVGSIDIDPGGKRWRTHG